MDPDAFDQHLKFGILDVVSPAEIDKKEYTWMHRLNSFQPVGINIEYPFGIPLLGQNWRQNGITIWRQINIFRFYNFLLSSFYGIYSKFDNFSLDLENLKALDHKSDVVVLWPAMGKYLFMTPGKIWSKRDVILIQFWPKKSWPRAKSDQKSHDPGSNLAKKSHYPGSNLI